jgi:hypothetical protein
MTVPPWTLPPKLTVLGSARKRSVMEDMGPFASGQWRRCGHYPGDLRARLAWDARPESGWTDAKSAPTSSLYRPSRLSEATPSCNRWRPTTLVVVYLQRRNRFKTRKKGTLVVHFRAL